LPAPGYLYVRNKSEFEQAILNVKDGEMIVVASGVYDLGLQEIKRNTSASMVTIRAERPNICYSEPGTGVTLNGTTLLRVWTDNWKIEGFCFEGINNKGVFPNVSFSDTVVIKVSASNVLISQNVFKNIGGLNNHATLIEVGGGTNLNAERKHIENINITRNRFSNIAGIGIDFPQPSAVYTGPYVWALRPTVTYNTFENSPLVFDNGGEAIHLGTGWDFSDTFSDNMGANISKNFFHKWDGDGELISVKSSGNFLEDNLLYNNIGNISIRAGEHNTIRSNYMISHYVSCHGFRVSGYGNLFDRNFLDLNSTCIAWSWTTKRLEGNPVYEPLGLTISTYPSKKNYFRWNKVKNAQNVVWLLNDNKALPNIPPLQSDLPTDNTLNWNYFYNMKSSKLIHADVPVSVITQNELERLNLIGKDNIYR
jgi:hypothetical protein